jgi:type VI secretion system protein ImpL
MKHTTSKPISPEIQKKLERLQKRFQGIVSFLKKTTINKLGKEINLTDLPWYLFIGPSSSGKTTLLANSNINFLLAKKFKPENLRTIAPSEVCDWWITRDLVLLDVPNSYLVSPSILWNTLLKSIKTTIHKNSLQGVVIALNLPELLKEQTNTQIIPIIAELKKRILECRNEFGNHLPFYLIVTKCDFLPGFCEFFSECSSEELAQAWGITLPPSNQHEKWSELFTHRFNALIKRLNKQLIWRLHQERDPAAKSSIKDFPLHVERLKENIAQFIKSLNIPDLSWRGIYLTCGMQDDSKKQLSYLPSLNHSLVALTTPVQPRSCFVHQLIHHGLLSAERSQKTPSSNIWIKRLSYAASVFIVLIAASFLGYDFQNGLHRTNLIKNDLIQYQLNLNQPGDHVASAVALLNELKQNAEKSNQISFYSNQSQQTAVSLYHQALETIALNEAKNHLEKAIKNTEEKNPEQAYLFLTAYLMLNDVHHFQSETMIKAFEKILPTSTNKNIIAAFVDHIKTSVSLSNSFNLNVALIQNVRKQLTSLPGTTLGYVILKNMDNNNQDSDINLDAQSNSAPIFISKSVATQILNMFTAANFQKILIGATSVAAVESLQGNWTLGSRTGYTPNQTEINNLASLLRNQYIANYVDVWESLLANIQLVAPNNLEEADATVSALTSDHSPLLQMLHTIRENTAFPPITNVSPKLQSLSTMLSAVDNNQQSKLYPIFIGLKELHFYLSTVLTAENQNDAAYQIMLKRIKDTNTDPIRQIHIIAEQTPDPMKTWLNSLATQSQHLISQKAKENYLCKAAQKKKNPVCLG